MLCFSARELELEDRQSRLQQELRERMAVDGNKIDTVNELQQDLVYLETFRI